MFPIVQHAEPVNPLAPGWNALQGDDEIMQLFADMGVDARNLELALGGNADLTSADYGLGAGAQPGGGMGGYPGLGMHGVGIDPYAAAYGQADMANYQAGVPTLTVEQYIQRRDLLVRRMTDISEKGFLVDALLRRDTQGIPGGTLAYTRSESIYLAANPEEIPEGGPYPIAGDVAVTPLIAEAKKYGLKTFITEEMVRRNQFPQVDIKVTKLTNSIIRYLDTLFMGRIRDDADIQTRAVSGGAWSTTSTSIDDDIFLAVADIRNQQEGYEPDTLVLHPNKLPVLLGNDQIRQAYVGSLAPRNPIFTGQLPPLFGLDIFWSPNLLQADGVTPANFAYVMQREMIGAIADEVPMEVITLPFDHDYDRVWLKGRRVAATYLTEPKALVKITGI